jgi:hypothetical protein
VGHAAAPRVSFWPLRWRTLFQSSLAASAEKALDDALGTDFHRAEYFSIPLILVILPPRAALEAAVATSGRAVLFSGTAGLRPTTR